MRWWSTRSLRARLVAGFALTATLLVVAASVTIYTLMSRQLIDVVDAALDDRMVDLTIDVEQGAVQLEGDDRLTQILDIDGTVVATSAAAPRDAVLVDPATVEQADEGDVIRQVNTIDGLPHRIRVRAETVMAEDGPVIVVVARSLGAVDAQRRTLLQAVLLGTPLLAAAIACLVWLLARRILSPVQTMAEHARLLSVDPTADLDLGSYPGGDEFSALASSFRDLLDRIADARRHERSFVDNVSHELRTPLAILRGEIELAASGPIDDPESAASLEQALRQVDRMTALVNRLLHMTRIEVGQVPVHRSPTHVVDLVRELIAAHPNDRGLDVGAVHNPPDPGPVDVDPDIVVEILTNLLDNACRHAATTVVVETVVTDDEIVLRVRDDGPGLPTMQPRTSFDRFATVGARETEGRPRVGLGLSIVQALVTLHGGSVKLASNADGSGATATVRLRLQPHAKSR